MIAQIKHPWKPRCGVALLVPQAFFGLCAYQVLYATLDRRMLDLAGRHQTKQGPCRLRGRGWRALIALVVESVPSCILAPAAILVLDRHQPIRRFANRRIAMIDAGG